MLSVRYGITRTVILTKRYAIKFPSLRGGSGWVRGARLKFWAEGIIANHSEMVWSEHWMTSPKFARRIDPDVLDKLHGIVRGED